MGTPNKYTKEMCDLAEKVLSDGESLAAVCAELNITRTTLYDWRDNNPEFSEAIDRGLVKCQRYWEKIGKRGITGKYEKFSGAPWIFTMKNRFRNDYKEDKEVKSDNSALIEKLIDKLVD